jgi:hypothetical protein
MRCVTFHLESGDNVFVSSDATRILLQLRREVPTQQDILSPSFKVAFFSPHLFSAQTILSNG